MYQNGYEQYKMQSVNTMTHGEMLLLLYDELIKRLTRAQLALNDENYESFDKSVQRSKDIVHYLDQTLNMEYEISYELRRMYEFFLYELRAAGWKEQRCNPGIKAACSGTERRVQGSKQDGVCIDRRGVWIVEKRNFCRRY